MKTVFVTGCIFLAFMLIALIRVHVRFVYDCDGVKLYIKALFLKFTVYPQAKDKPQEKPAKKEQHPQKKGGELPELKELIELGKETFGKLRRKLRIDLLKAEVSLASDDPFKTAMMFGGAGAGVGIILATLENIFNVKDRDIKVNANFSESKIRILLNMDISIRVGAAIAIGLFVVLKFIKLQKSVNKTDEVKQKA